MSSSLYSIFRNKILNLKLILSGVQCDLRTIFYKSDNSSLIVCNSSILNCDISVKKKSKIIFGKNCIIQNCKIIVESESEFKLGDNCKLINATIVVKHQSELVFGNDCLVQSDKPYYEALINVISGSAQFGTNANIKGRVLVNDGCYKMGSNSFINHGSEIRCENSVTIGDYVFISYFVDVFDTNTHSLDWEARKKEVVDGYPNNTVRIVQPNVKTVLPVTKPVKIGDSVWVGKYAAIMKGCDIGARSIIGTRSVVTKSFSEDSLICGNPAVFVKTV